MHGQATGMRMLEWSSLFQAIAYANVALFNLNLEQKFLFWDRLLVRML